MKLTIDIEFREDHPFTLELRRGPDAGESSVVETWRPRTDSAEVLNGEYGLVSAATSGRN
jgi:hypothetical protein